MPKKTRPLPTSPAVPAVAVAPETKRAIPSPVPRSLAATENPLAIAENASFVHFSQLKVPSGKDRYTAMNRRRLLAELGGDRADIQQEIEQLWQQFNDDEEKQIPYGKTTLDSVLRWHLRGLTLKSAIKKVRVDRETRRLTYAKRKAETEAEEIAIAFAIFAESCI